MWEAFHARDNATARFYKERRYLLLEFPVLAVQEPPQHIVELGCGCGSALLPVLKVRTHSRSLLCANHMPKQISCTQCKAPTASHEVNTASISTYIVLHVHLVVSWRWTAAS